MRLIDGDALGDELYALYVHASPMYKSLITKIKKMVDKAPTAKFKLNTVVHATWIKSDYPFEKYKCSACGCACWYYDYEAEVARSRFCPNCGARMDGEEDAEI